MKEKDIIFIENEMKNDWWEDSNKKIVSKSLKDEFEIKNSKSFFTMNDFYEFFKIEFEKVYDSFSDEEKFVFNNHKEYNRSNIINLSDEELIEYLNYPFEEEFAIWLNEEWDRKISFENKIDAYVNKIYTLETAQVINRIERNELDHYLYEISIASTVYSFIDVRIESINSEFEDVFKYLKINCNFTTSIVYNVINTTYDITNSNYKINNIEITDDENDFGFPKQKLSEG